MRVHGKAKAQGYLLAMTMGMAARAQHGNETRDERKAAENSGHAMSCSVASLSAQSPVR
jgi:hypothetical protein